MRIDIYQVSKRFGAFTALAGVDLSLADGELVAPVISLHFPELHQAVGKQRVPWFDFQGSFPDPNRVAEPLRGGEQGGVAKHRFGTAGTQRKCLPEREVGLLQHPLLFGASLGGAGTPGVTPADGGPQLGE